MSQSIRISAADGYALGGTLFEGGQGPVVVVNGATGVHQRYYARFATWLAEQGATVVTYDYRGIGESRPFRLRGFDARLRDWGQQDVEGVLQFARRRFPGRALTVVGHSVGGQLLGLAPSIAHVTRAVTVAAQSGYWGHWPAPSRVAFAGLWYGLMPLTTRAVGFFPGQLGIGEHLPHGVALEWARWCRSAGYLADHLPTDGYARLTAPVLAFSFTDDAYAPKAAVDWLHQLYTAAPVERRHLDPEGVGARRVGHFGFFRDRFRESLWTPVAAHLLAGAASLHLAPAPTMPAVAPA